MTIQINDAHMAFMHEAKEAFSNNNELETYFNKDDFDLIALRFGRDRDCVMIYELGDSIANFVQQMEPKPKPTKEITGFAFEMQTVFDQYPVLANKSPGYVFGSIVNVVDGLSSALQDFPYKQGGTKNACVNLAVQAMILAEKAEGK